MVIVSAARLNTDILHGRNLDAGNVASIPGICKNGVGKPNGLYIAHHLFSEIVVNAINILWGECSFQALIECACILQCFAKGLFQDNLAALCVSNLE